MAPETRQRGVPPPSRVYNASPTLRQAQFPSRRTKVVRTYGRQAQAGLRQQTLTQIDFVSSFSEDDVVALTDSDDDEGGDKENRHAGPAGGEQPAQDCSRLRQGDEEPVSRTSRGQGKRPAPVPAKAESSRRRRTMGDEVDAIRAAGDTESSRRQTLGTAQPARSNHHTQTLTQFLGQRSFIADSDDDEGESSDRGPGGSDAEDDSDFMHWLGQADSPGVQGGQQQHLVSTTAASRAGSAAADQDSVVPQTPAKRKAAVRFVEVSSPCVERYGPPDGHESPLKDRSSPSLAPSAVVELAGVPRFRQRRGTDKAPSSRHEIPDSDDDDDGGDSDGDSDDNGGSDDDGGDFVAGPETQAVLHELASTPQPRPGSPPDADADATPPVDTRLHLPAASSPSRSQVLESQRVPVAVLQALPPPSARSDILLPTAPSSLAPLVAGRVRHLAAPFKIPSIVVRFWLLDARTRLLRYVACVQGDAPPLPASPPNAWRFPVFQVYELNDPVSEARLRDDDCLAGPIANYAYLPPAVVAKLLWNLRHALFAHPDHAPGPAPVLPAVQTPAHAAIAADISSHTAYSTQVVPSTPEGQTTSACEPPPIPPSQATTASQCSTPSPLPPSPPPLSSSLAFPDPLLSSESLSSFSALPASSASQLLTRSQMLSDSLLSHEPDIPPPSTPEIGDSDDDQVPL